MTEETDFPSEIDNNKNKNTIRCQFCDSIILKAKSANYSENEVSSINIDTHIFCIRWLFMCSSHQGC